LTPPAVFSFESLAPWILAFALFRFFDIKKPWLVGRAEKLPGAFGIMADDIVAGVFSLVIMIICQLIIQ
jgi:phosphatidylglycerophosphatase A